MITDDFFFSFFIQSSPKESLDAFLLMKENIQNAFSVLVQKLFTHSFKNTDNLMCLITIVLGGQFF